MVFYVTSAQIPPRITEMDQVRNPTPTKLTDGEIISENIKRTRKTRSAWFNEVDEAGATRRTDNLQIVLFV